MGPDYHDRYAVLASHLHEAIQRQGLYRRKHIQESSEDGWRETGGTFGVFISCRSTDCKVLSRPVIASGLFLAYIQTSQNPIILMKS